MVVTFSTFAARARWKTVASASFSTPSPLNDRVEAVDVPGAPLV